MASENRLRKIEAEFGQQLRFAAEEDGRARARRGAGVPPELSEIWRDDLFVLAEVSAKMPGDGGRGDAAALAALGEKKRGQYLRICEIVKTSTARRTALELLIAGRLGGGKVVAGACVVADLDRALGMLEGRSPRSLFLDFVLAKLAFVPAG